MQLMPATARRYGAFAPFDVEQNIAAGTRYVTTLMWEFHGGPALGRTAAYYAGNRNIARKQLDYRNPGRCGLCAGGTEGSTCFRKYPAERPARRSTP